MKKLVFCIVLLVAAGAWGQTTYTHIDDSTAVDNGLAGAVGWGSCISCAGGGSNGTISSSPFQTTPSADGASRDFYISGAGYTNGLWWYKVGPKNTVSHFTFSFWLNVNSGTQYAQALEFDAFQYISGQEYEFGTQCNYQAGLWQIWNASTHKWVNTSIRCTKFKFNTWYNVTLNFHRTSPDKYEHYDSLNIVQYQNGSVVASNTYSFNKSLPSGPTPAGWTDNMGVQFQMDIGATGATMQEWVDKVKLTVW